MNLLKEYYNQKLKVDAEKAKLDQLADKIKEQYSIGKHTEDQYQATIYTTQKLKYYDTATNWLQKNHPEALQLVPDNKVVKQLLNQNSIRNLSNIGEYQESIALKVSHQDENEKTIVKRK